MNLVTRVVLVLAAVLAVAFGVFVVTAWAPDRPVDELRERWAPEPSRFLEIDGMSVHLRDEGLRDNAGNGSADSGPPIVLLHGTSDSLHTWNGWAEVLGRDRRVIRFDMPGFGLTGPFPHDDYRIERYVEFVLTVLDELDVDKAVLGGNSLGGRIAWEAAHAAPERVPALVLVASAGYPADSSMPIGFRMAQIPLFEPLMTRMLPRSMIRASVRDVYGDPDQVTPELVDRYYELTLREGNRAALVRRFAADDMEGDPERIRGLEQPALVLWGARDRLLPPEAAGRFHEDLPNSEMTLYEDLGHVPQEEAPTRTANRVRDFLSDKEL